MTERQGPFALVIALLGLTGLLVFPTPCQACTCVPITAGEAFATADTVFRGRVIEVEELTGLDRRFGETHLARLRADTIWKGEMRAEFLVTGGDGGTCGAVFKEGEEYLVYALGWGDQALATNYCLMSAGDLASLGPGKPAPTTVPRPSPADRESSRRPAGERGGPTSLLIAGIAGAAVLAAVALRRSRGGSGSL